MNLINAHAAYYIVPFSMAETLVTINISIKCINNKKGNKTTTVHAYNISASICSYIGLLSGTYH